MHPGCEQVNLQKLKKHWLRFLGGFALYDLISAVLAAAYFVGPAPHSLGYTAARFWQLRKFQANGGYLSKHTHDEILKEQ